jgi:hypothetical protein
MGLPFDAVADKLWVLAALSMAAVPSLLREAQAHEVQPTIADLTVTEEGVIAFELRLNVEAFLAGVDLDAVSDINEDAASADYDRLRALDAAGIAGRLPEFVARWNAHPLLVADAPILLTLDEAVVPEDVDFDLPRVTELTLRAVLPESAEAVTVRWPEGSGALVLRQQGVEEPYTGYLNGGDASPAISVPASGGWFPLNDIFK